jgi:TolB protein
MTKNMAFLFCVIIDKLRFTIRCFSGRSRPVDVVHTETSPRRPAFFPVPPKKVWAEATAYSRGRLLLLVVLSIGICRAERVSLESYAHNLDSLPIAVLSFVSTDEGVISSNEPWSIISDDLIFSGRFEVTRCDTADTVMFLSKNIPVFIDGKYSMKGSFVVLDCYLHDAGTKDVIAEKQYSGNSSSIRTMAHSFSNEIVEMLFNDKGIFTSRICYVRDDGSIKNIFVMDYDGHNLNQLTNNKSLNIFPAFMDTSNVLWTSYSRGQADIFKININTGKFHALIGGRATETSPSVSSIYGKIAFASTRDGNMEIYVCEADGTGVKRLTFNKSIDTSPCWAPSGVQIVFTSDRGGSPQIYIMDADGANVHRLTYQGNYQDSPAWSPKGDKIAYMSQSGGKFDIWTIQPDGSNAFQVTDMAGSNEYPAWSADGAHIVFSSRSGNTSNLYAIKADGTHLKKLTSTGNAKMPDWSE